MSDEDKEMWNDYKEGQKERRLERLPGRQEEIKSLTGMGYTVKEMDRGYCFRINNEYDLYPIHNRWHHLPTGKRGGTGNLKTFILKWIPLNLPEQPKTDSEPGS